MTERLTLKETYTYGALLGDAYGRLARWCQEDPDRTCTDSYARLVLAQTGVDGVLDLAPDKKSFLNFIEIRLITRIYLVQNIDEKREYGGSQGVSSVMGESIAPPANDGVAPVPGDNKSTVVRGADMVAMADPKNRSTSAVLVRNTSNGVILNNVFARPLAFGYGAVSILMQPSKPDQGVIP